jgi:hypothetical protein
MLLKKSSKAKQMKRHFNAFLTIIMFTSQLYSQTLSTKIIFTERVFDFGTILEKNGKVSHTFVFHNKGKAPVILSDIHSGCGCIGTVLSKVPVKPGGKGEVRITFNPDYKSGFFSKEIIIYSNNNQEYSHVWIQGVVVPAEHPVSDDYPYNYGEGLWLRLKVMAFGYMKPGETKQMDLNYANDTNKEMTLSFIVEGNSKGLKFTNPGKLAPKARGKVTFTYSMPYLGGNDVQFTVYPYVNNKKLKEAIEIKILNEFNLNQKKMPK